MSLWEQDGKLVENAGGTALVECDDCPCEEAGADCNKCNGTGRTPLHLNASVSGLVPSVGPPTCNECADLNADYVLTQLAGDHCYWRYYFTGGACATDYLEVFLFAGGIAAGFIRTDALINCQWSKAIAIPADCDTLDVTLALADFSSNFCNGVTPTIRIWA